MTNKAIVEKVMTKVEEFYMGNDENSGEAIFNKFAEENKDVFNVDDDFANTEVVEGKLEWTEVHQKYVATLE